MPSSANRRMPLSCEPCRERKIRCSRDSRNYRGPCETCIRRKIDPSECVYLRDLYPRVHVVRPQPTLEPGNEELLARISNLEELLRRHGIQGGSQDAVSGRASSRSESISGGSIPIHAGEETTTLPITQAGTYLPGEPSLDSAYSSRSRLTVSTSGHVRYEPLSSRWSPVLGDSAMGSDVLINGNPGVGPDEFPLSSSKLSVDDLLAKLPPKSACNALKDIYFNVFAPLWHVLHDPTFLSDYNRFLRNPTEVSPTWLALLFSVLAVAAASLDEDSELLADLGQHPTASENISSLARRYRTAALECLEADHYLWRHNLHTLQTLIILIYGINHSHGQSWTLLGLTRNIAVSIGCRVDPDNFDLDIVQAEERRRCWAALNMLYTIQNTAMGDFRNYGYGTQSAVKLPLDVDDERLVPNGDVPTPSREVPSIMSYLLCKFQLYEICRRIAQLVEDEEPCPPYATITAIDEEIATMQNTWNFKYLIDTQNEGLPDYHAVHLNVLFSYSHQLFLLLHRPVLMRHRSRGLEPWYTHQQFLASRKRCLDSARALLDIQRNLHEDETFRPYRWYNRGIGSFHAFHGAILLAYLAAISTDMDLVTLRALQENLNDAIDTFDKMARGGSSRICQQAVPILRRLSVFANNAIGVAQEQSKYESSFTSLMSQGQGMFSRAKSLRQVLSTGHDVPVPSLDSFAGVLHPQNWMSPSSFNWNSWDHVLQNDVSPLENGQASLV